jgi:quercetin dioxygenase-like cupin family protein
MKVIKGSQIPQKDMIEDPAYAHLMTGPGPARIQNVLGKQDGDVKFALARSHMNKGTRNRLHTHTEDQLLIVIGGKGVVSTGKKETIVSEGDIIYIPAGEKHYHGAAKDSEYHQYSLTIVGSKTDLCEE